MEAAFLELFLEMVLRHAFPAGAGSPWGQGVAGEFYRDLFLQAMAGKVAATLRAGLHFPGAARAPSAEAGPATHTRLRP